MKTMKIKPLERKRHSMLIQKLVMLLLVILVQSGASNSGVFGNEMDVNRNDKITGVVKDVNGATLIGVTVKVKETGAVSITNVDGQYSLTNVPDKATLLFSYVGFDPLSVKVDGQASIDVTLKEDTELLNEVVVIGYGTVKKSNLSGAVSTVSGKDLEKLPAANISQALQGNAPGLYSLQSDRNPGASVSLNIRGNNSFSGGSPLFIVDGFPIASDGGVNAINPNDIESISVLKDASSTAIYGARAANGVILITTKTGKVGKPVLEVTSYWGIKNINNPIELMNAEQFMQLRKDSYQNDMLLNPNLKMPDLLAAELGMLDSGRSTNWWDEVTRQNSLTQNYQVSYSSGTETSKIHVGMGLFDEQGIVNNSGFTRGNMRFNATQKFGERVTISSYNSVSLSSTRGVNETNVLFPAMVGSPMAPIKDENGKYYGMIQNSLGTPRANPVAFSELPINKSMNPLVNLSLALDIMLAKGLKIRSQISGEMDYYRRNFYNPKAISGEDESNGRISGGYAAVRSRINYNWISETTLSYNTTFNKMHAIDAVAGFSVQQNRWEDLNASASGFASDIYETYNLGAGSAAARKPSSNLVEWNMLSYIGRAVYTLHDKYILTGNIRVDGSSRFGKDNKYGYFPSGAAAWRLSEEKFIQDINWIADLKLRGSYGLSGNANAIAPYQTLSMLEYASYTFNGTEAPGYYESKLPSANLKWETTTQLDLGMDLAILNNRLNFTLDYYSKKTKDLIRQIDIPSSMGFPKTYVNMGEMENKGIEIGINSINMQGEFLWKTSFMLATNKNKLLSLGDGEDKIGTSHWVGKPLGIGERYMIEANGIWQTSEKAEAAKYGAVPGDVKYVDRDNSGTIDDKDRTFIGSYYPNFYGSMTNTFGYKNFDLNVFITFSQGRDIYNGNNYVLLSGATADNNRVEMLKRWTPTNPSNKYPRASATRANRISDRTSEFLEDGSYLKIKNITLGYIIPETISSRLGMSHFRVYASLTNPFTFTKFTGMDPEDGDIGNNDRRSTYPISTTYMLGLQIKF